jgi:hypothetical protein
VAAAVAAKGSGTLQCRGSARIRSSKLQGAQRPPVGNRRSC